MKDIRQNWKALAAKKEITRSDIAALCIYRSLLKDEGKEGAISRLKGSFRPITNPIKLDNGAYPYGSLRFALSELRSSHLISWLDLDDAAKILDIAKSINAWGKDIT